MRTHSRAAGAATLVLAFIAGATSFAAGPPTVQITAPTTPPIQAGGAPSQFRIAVTNDAAGDQPTVTSFTLNGAPCTPATCGSFGPVTGTSGSGAYTMTYTPPPSSAAVVSPTVTVSPSPAGQSFPATVSFAISAAGIVIEAAVTAPGLSVVQVGSAARTITYTTFNDVGNAGLTFTLTGGGYACQNLGQNSCGILGTPKVSTSGTTTTTVVNYTPPPSIPDEPYDRPRIQATSVTDPTKVNSLNFLLNSYSGPTSIPYAQKFDSAFTGGAPVTVAANFSDTTTTRTATWSLTANGAPCPACGTLGTPTATANGNVITSTVTYTPPASVPAGKGQNSPTITAVLTSNPTIMDNFSFNLVDGTCGAGNEAILSGQYAFLMKGGGASNGYVATVGSFTADGRGNITGGLEDFNRSISFVPNSMLAGSYSVGPDNRGCVTLTASTGGTQTFRIALGTISGGAATQGAITRFDDTTGQSVRVAGILKQQNLAALDSSTLSGTYAFGEEGVDGSGYRIAAAGLLTLDGAGNVTNLTLDVNDGGNATAIPGGSGSYSLAANAPSGRGTIQIMIPTGGGPETSNSAVYVISPSDFFFMTTDLNDAGQPILIGEAKLQTGPFSTSALASGSGYVFYTSGVIASNGGSDIILGQTQFSSNTGNATLTIDENDYGIDAPETSLQATFTVDSSGRTTLAGLGPTPPVIYLVDSTQGFIVGTDGSVQFGYLQQQTLTSFSTSAISGQFFFGGGAPTTGTSFDTGTVNISPGTTSGTLTGTTDGSQPNCGQNPNQNCGGNGLAPNKPIPGFPYTFSTGPAAPGQGCIGGAVAPQACLGALIGYIVSPSKIVFMQTGTPDNTNAAELFIAQQ
jgi:hypothetical protein